MKIAIIYTSKSGNTDELVKILYKFFLEQRVTPDLFRIEEFLVNRLQEYDAIVVGTYTWGDGNIPQEMERLYHAFETMDVERIITGVAGTGDRFYPKFCGAVDEFRDMLYVHTQLAVTLKIELMPQKTDLVRCRRFVEIMLEHLQKSRVTLRGF
ncbi:flavodoxin domain-containing protein [Neobacillus fumarioli]|uniref:flavodoxin domain-containing protein n=1 Tax=Neobacillus fumarioli TaxID=105229 RepID=UPI000837896F|nr:flavodoxin domain-containing protein [Neobacillus fumarioli]